MYDLRTLRDQFDSIQDQLGPRGQDVAWAELQKLLGTRRDMISQVEALRHQLKNGSKEVAQLKRNKQPADDAIASMRAVGDHIKTQEEQLHTVEHQLEEHTLQIPNIPHHTIPKGSQDRKSVV